MRALQKRTRRGAVTVEFAVIAPVLVTLVLGVAEAGRLLEIHNELATAAREGARLAGMDRADFLNEGQSTNDKIVEDVRNMLSSFGLPGAEANVNVCHPDCPESAFDLDDPSNTLALFELRIELPYSALNSLVPEASDFILCSKVVFRNGASVMVQ